MAMKITGWLVLDNVIQATGMDPGARDIYSNLWAEFHRDEEETDESPYSNDEGVIQFHVALTWDEEDPNYPKMEVIE